MPESSRKEGKGSLGAALLGRFYCNKGNLINFYQGLSALSLGHE
jgi:hypothetical protein